VVGAVITVGFTYLFGPMHTMMVAALALTIALVLLTISALDYPLGVHSARRARRLPVGPAEDRTRLNSASFEKEHSVNSVTFGVLNAMHIVQKFEQLLLNTHRRPDGSRWTSQRLEEATDGLVTRSYFVNLQKGRIENPGYEKMAAIAKAMGFPPGAWFDEDAGVAPSPVSSSEGRGLAGRAEHLFDAVRNPKTGEPYTNPEIARMTLGDLSEEDVEGIRTGTIGDRTGGQVAALAGVFGVEPSYLLDRSEPPLDRELVEALRDEAVRDAVREISRLSERERHLVLGIVRQFGSPDE
jgi:transcriptional regulator with XRE-family HTH domain